MPVAVGVAAGHAKRKAISHNSYSVNLFMLTFLSNVHILCYKTDYWIDYWKYCCCCKAQKTERDKSQ